MHCKSVALLALASVAIASPNAHLAKRAVSLNPTEISVEAVLATALPPSLVSIGLTNPGELGSIIASSFSAGNTPAWYSALPSDVKSYLPLLYAEATSTIAIPSSTPAPSSASAATSASVVTVVSTSVASVSATISPSGNSTMASTVHSATLTTTTVGSKSSKGASSGASSAGASSASSSTSTGGASYPTAVMGAGIAGALGFLGMLAM